MLVRNLRKKGDYKKSILAQEENIRLAIANDQNVSDARKKAQAGIIPEPTAKQSRFSEQVLTDALEIKTLAMNNLRSIFTEEQANKFLNGDGRTKALTTDDLEYLNIFWIDLKPVLMTKTGLTLNFFRDILKKTYAGRRANYGYSTERTRPANSLVVNTLDELGQTFPRENVLTMAIDRARKIALVDPRAAFILKELTTIKRFFPTTGDKLQKIPRLPQAKQQEYYTRFQKVFEGWETNVEEWNRVLTLDDSEFLKEIVNLYPDMSEFETNVKKLYDDLRVEPDAIVPDTIPKFEPVSEPVEPEPVEHVEPEPIVPSLPDKPDEYTPPTLIEKKSIKDEVARIKARNSIELKKRADEKVESVQQDYERRAKEAKAERLLRMTQEVAMRKQKSILEKTKKESPVQFISFEEAPVGEVVKKDIQIKPRLTRSVALTEEEIEKEQKRLSQLEKEQQDRETRDMYLEELMAIPTSTIEQMKHKEIKLRGWLLSRNSKFYSDEFRQSIRDEATALSTFVETKREEDYKAKKFLQDKRYDVFSQRIIDRFDEEWDKLGKPLNDIEFVMFKKSLKKRYIFSSEWEEPIQKFLDKERRKQQSDEQDRIQYERMKNLMKQQEEADIAKFSAVLEATISEEEDTETLGSLSKKKPRPSVKKSPKLSPVGFKGVSTFVEPDVLERQTSDEGQFTEESMSQQLKRGVALRKTPPSTPPTTPLKGRPTGKGISLKPTTFIEFGKFKLNENMLEEGTLQVKTMNGSPVPTFSKKVAISDTLQAILMDLIETQKLRGVSDLDVEERRMLETLLIKAGLAHGLGVKKIHQSDEDAIKVKRFDLVKGIYEAGNNSVEVIHELRSLILYFIKTKRLDKKAGMEALQELQ